MFVNRLDNGKYPHNQHSTNATQSLQNIMDLVDLKFEKLKDKVKRLGIKPQDFRKMVESKSLFEWNSEVALDVFMRQCEWVVREDQEEEDQDGDDLESTD